MSHLMTEIRTLHQFPHVANWGTECDEMAPKRNNNSDDNDTHSELLEVVSSIRLPNKEEFRQIVKDKSRSSDLYSTLLDICSQLDGLIIEQKKMNSATVDELPQYWTVLGSPYYHRARAMALREFHSPQSSYFLPNDDQMIMRLLRSWCVFPNVVFRSKHGCERILAWIKTLYILEGAAIRNRVMGVRMSSRHYRKYDGKTLSQSLLPRGYTVTHQMIKRAILMRDICKRRGIWKSMDNGSNFWEHYKAALMELREMPRSEAESYLTNLVKKDQSYHGKF